MMTGPDAQEALQVEQANEALFRRQIAAWAKNDLDSLLDCFAEDLVYVDMPFPDQPVRGKAAFREHMRTYNRLFAGGVVHVELVTLVATRENVVGELLTTAQYVGPGAPAGGVPVTWYATLVDTVVDGRVVAEHAYFDPASFDNAVTRAQHQNSQAEDSGLVVSKAPLSDSRELRC